MAAAGQAAAAAKRAFVLETDLGSDPDDVLALLLLARYCRRNGIPFAVVTSAETAGHMRARAVHWVLQQANLLAQGDMGDTIVAAGPEYDPDEPQGRATEPFVCGLAAVLGAAGVPAARDVAEPAVGGAGEGLEPAAERFPGLESIHAFIVRQHSAEARRRVTWIGIGAMTNLAATLAAPGAAAVPEAAAAAAAAAAGGRAAHLPDDIFQMGTCIRQLRDKAGETNIMLHPGAAVDAIAAADALHIPLTLVTLDTTGYGLHWLNGVDDCAGPWPASEEDDKVLRCRFPPGGIAAHLRELLWARVPGAAAVLAASTRCMHRPHLACDSRYFGRSSLHDPLTVLVAIDSPAPDAPDAPDRPGGPRVVPVAAGEIQISRTTGFVITLRADVEAVKARQTLSGSLVKRDFWDTDGRSFNGAPYDAPSPGPLSRVNISLGPLTHEEIARVHARLQQLMLGDHLDDEDLL